MSHSLLNNAYASGTLAAVNDAVTFYPSSDCDTYFVAVDSVASVAGLVVTVEVQLRAGGPWYKVALHVSFNGAGNTNIQESAVVASQPDYFWIVTSGTSGKFGSVQAIRARASAITGGSAVVRIVPGA